MTTDFLILRFRPLPYGDRHVILRNRVPLCDASHLQVEDRAAPFAFSLPGLSVSVLSLADRRSNGAELSGMIAPEFRLQQRRSGGGGGISLLFPEELARRRSSSTILAPRIA